MASDELPELLPHPGVYGVGSDIKAGTWHTPGDGGSGDQCYYAVLNSTNTSDIANNNNNFDGGRPSPSPAEPSRSTAHAPGTGRGEEP